MDLTSNNDRKAAEIMVFALIFPSSSVLFCHIVLQFWKSISRPCILFFRLKFASRKNSYRVGYCFRKNDTILSPKTAIRLAFIFVTEL